MSLSDLTTHPEAEALVLSRDTANHSHRADAQGFAELDGLLFDLLGQLTSGCQNHSVRALVRVLNSREDKQDQLKIPPTLLHWNCDQA